MSSVRSPEIAEEKQLPYLPAQLKPGELGANGKLLSDEKIAELEIKYAAAGDCRPHKADSQTQYRIVKLSGEYYAVLNSVLKDNKKQKRYIGEGGFAKVEAAQNLKSGLWYALKTQRYRSDLSDERRACHFALFQNENRILQKLSLSKGNTIFHQSCMPRTGLKSPPTVQLMLMELAPGKDLEEIVFGLFKKQIALPDRCLLDIVIQILRFASHLYHDLKILHCDLKLENIMFNIKNNTIKIIDFGFAGSINEDGDYITEISRCTLGYTAPDVESPYRNTFIYNQKTEIFSLGMTIRALLGFKMLEDGNWVYVAYPSELSRNQKIATYLNRMINRNAMLRPTLKSAVEFFEGMQKELFPENPETPSVLTASLFKPGKTKSQKVVDALKSILPTSTSYYTQAHSPPRKASR